jgi:hypothetical protein
MQRAGRIAAGEPHHVLALLGEAGHKRINVFRLGRSGVADFGALPRLNGLLTERRCGSSSK